MYLNRHYIWKERRKEGGREGGSKGREEGRHCQKGYQQ
jgi:hypothetical protein